MFFCFNRNKEEEYIYTNKEENIIRNLKQIYGDLYDYSKLRYSKYSKLIIICKKHGEFKQSYNILINSGGCYKCHSQKTIDKLYNYFYT